MGNRSTYSTMSRWFKWASLFILLIPLAIFIMAIVNYFKPFDLFNNVTGILDIILLVLSVVWLVLSIILFFAAGTVKEKASPLAIRIGLIISFALVFAPAIVYVLVAYKVIPEQTKGLEILVMFLPLIIALGYLVSYNCAKSAQRKTA